MKRENLALLARARHDSDARRQVAEHYLVGSDGFPRHEQTALEYLDHPSVRDSAEAARIVCKHLSLERLISLGHEALLGRAANAGCAEAQFKLAVWMCVGRGEMEAAERWMSVAATAGHSTAKAVVKRLGADRRDEASFNSALSAVSSVEIEAIAVQAGQMALAKQDFRRGLDRAQVALAFTPDPTPTLARLVKSALMMAVASETRVVGLNSAQIERSLDMLSADGDIEASYLLGSALCGFGCGRLAAADLASGSNLRKGAALLLRAADAGRNEAWMHLYRIHADHRCSVSNPQLSRFFLEKAASLGDPEAQRRLGALILRAADGLKESENALHWLHSAATQGDAHAARLLRTLVLPVAGDADEAQRVVDRMRSVDPWLAARMRLARDFGLTKLEALCVDPISGKRPWGLVVGKNPFITLSKLAAPRAIPALSKQATENLERAALLFEVGLRDGDMFEGDWRKRSARQRLLFARHGIDEAMFFAKAGSVALDALRKGPKWALRAKPSLSLALAS